MPKRAGRPSVAQTPAPKSDKIYGSKKNPKGSATEKKSKSITLSNKTIDTLKEKLDKFKKSHPAKKSITLGDLKAVYRRGSGAYSNSHRPTITGGAPNSRAAWSYARVNKFLLKAGGTKVKAAYVQDDDLMADGGKVFNDKELLAKYKKGESIGFTGEAHLKAKGLIPRADGTKKKSAKYMAKGGVGKGGDCYEAAAQFCMGFMPEPVEFVGEPYLVHAEVKGQGKAEGIRFGHAWVEDDENVYDYSNGRRIVMPKVVYYSIGDIQTENPEKYQRYTFPEARAKMLKTKHYGSWDIETEYAEGGEIYKKLKKVAKPKNSDFEKEKISQSELTEILKKIGKDKDFIKYANAKGRKDYILESFDEYSLTHGFCNPLSYYLIDKYDGISVYSGKNEQNGNHLFLKLGDKYFDAKNVEGVDNPKDLDFFTNKKITVKLLESNDLKELSKKYEEAIKKSESDRSESDNICISSVDRAISEYADGGDIRLAFEDGGQPSQLVTCINCSWEWETADSAEFDKYVCHQCGFDNSLFYDGGLLKPTITLAQIAEANLMKDYLKPVSIEYLQEQLNKGMQHEKEHTDSDEVATTIALHHLAERPDYYEELEKMKLEDGGEVSISDEDYEFWIGGDENFGKAIKQDGVIVGGIAYDENDQQINGIVIKNKFRKKGLAKKTVKALFDKNPDLQRVYVRAVPESKGFWKKIGTDFDNYNEDAGLWEGYVNRFEDGGEIDLFEDIDSLPENVQAVLAKYSGADETYTNAEAMLAELEPLGYTFEYGLDALPFNLREIDILEDNSPEEYEIEDFLKQQKEEAHMVMTCDSSKIYKAMICKTKCEIADKRMSETENPEELNAWLHYKNTWNDCLQDILDNNIEMYKAGGKTCGCGCGSIYSKGGLAFSKGGLAYGNSHDKGGMPMKVQSTGQNIEIEGGEGVINKRSMQSTKKVEFEGKQMTACEAVSKINEMGGGVKFKCADVKNIIEEDGQF